MPELVIIHEIGHNYWYHLVASNEFEEAWLDEGINTFSELQVVNEKYGPIGDIVDWLGIKVNDLQLQRGQYLAIPDYDPIVRKAWEFYSNGSYGINSYYKPGLLLMTLQNYLGKDTMQKILRTYFTRWRFRHPTTADFISVVNDVAGQDLSWFLNQALFTNAVLDYSVDRVSTKEIEAAKGYDFDLLVVAPDTTSADSSRDSTAQTTSQPMASLESSDSNAVGKQSPDSAVSKSKKEKMYYSVVSLRRLGSFTFPVEVEIVFANRDTIRENWDGKDLWKKFYYTKSAELVSATVDPQRKILLDVNFTNNSRNIKAQRLGVNKLAARWLFWMQFLLDQPGFLRLMPSLSIDI